METRIDSILGASLFVGAITNSVVSALKQAVAALQAEGCVGTASLKK